MNIPDDLLVDQNAFRHSIPDAQLASTSPGEQRTLESGRTRASSDRQFFEAEAVGQSELIRVTDLDEDLQVAAAELSTHTALDGGALVESIYVERILASRMEAML